jgi:hypothetical protein
LGQTTFFTLRLLLLEPFIWTYLTNIFPKLEKKELAASQGDGTPL